MGGDCHLCRVAGGATFWQDGMTRAVWVCDQGHAYTRVIWRDHVREMTDLNHAERQHLMNVVFAAEAALRTLLRPDKVNLASLGNQTPHLHWHVIPRWYDDAHFPDPIWAPARRRATMPRDVPPADLGALLAAALSEGACS